MHFHHPFIFTAINAFAPSRPFTPLFMQTVLPLDWTVDTMKIIIVFMFLSTALRCTAQGQGAGTTRVTICHKPGTPAQKQLEVDDNAIPGHVRHGDTVGECPINTVPMSVTPIQTGLASTIASASSTQIATPTQTGRRAHVLTNVSTTNCHHYAFNDNPFPDETPASPNLFSDEVISYVDSPTSGRAAILVPGQTMYSTIVDFNYDTGFTVVVWLKLSDFMGCAIVGCPVMGRYTPGADDDSWGYLLSVAPTTAGKAVLTFAVGAGPAMPRTVVWHPTAVVEGQNYRIAIAFDTTRMSLCVDGSCQTRATRPGLLGYKIDSRFVLGGPSTSLEVDELWICQGHRIESPVSDPSGLLTWGYLFISLS